jgi:predicted phage baseplate assembly protein
VGSFEKPPIIEDILLNAVYARHSHCYEKELLGSGTGAPGQSLRVAHGPLLPGMALYVNEGFRPPENELAMMSGEGVEEPLLCDGDTIWVRYREVENFYASTPFSRHFVVDYQHGVVHFGDGERGLIPPRIKFNIFARYCSGGGKAGNVASCTLRQLPQNIPFIAGVDNPYPAEGGADMEDVASLKARAAGVFKSLDRGVTAEDFQWLSHEASASVGRAWCLREKNCYGEIVVIVIPLVRDPEKRYQKCVPSRELLRRVRSYLDERKLVGTRLRVRPPVYRNFSIRLSVLFRSDVLDADRLKRSIAANLRSYFHPLEGGDGGCGWDFGHDVTRGMVLKQLEKIPAIFSVEDAALFDLDAGVTTERIALKSDELPYLEDVRVDNRREASV